MFRVTIILTIILTIYIAINNYAKAVEDTLQLNTQLTIDGSKASPNNSKYDNYASKVEFIANPNNEYSGFQFVRIKADINGNYILDENGKRVKEKQGQLICHEWTQIKPASYQCGSFPERIVNQDTGEKQCQHKHCSFYTIDGNGKMQARFDVQFGTDTPELEYQNVAVRFRPFSPSKKSDLIFDKPDGTKARIYIDNNNQIVVEDFNN